MLQESWTHMVRLNPDLPPTRDEYQTFDARNVYCYRDGDYLRAVGCALKAPGQKVAKWDDELREWCLRDGTVVHAIPKPQHAAARAKPHVTTTWATDQDEEGRTLCLPFKVKWGKDGQAVQVERVPIPNQTVKWAPKPAQDRRARDAQKDPS